MIAVRWIRGFITFATVLQSSCFASNHGGVTPDHGAHPTTSHHARRFRRHHNKTLSAKKASELALKNTNQSPSGSASFRNAMCIVGERRSLDDNAGYMISNLAIPLNCDMFLDLRIMGRDLDEGIRTLRSIASFHKILEARLAGTTTNGSRIVYAGFNYESNIERAESLRRTEASASWRTSHSPIDVIELMNRNACLDRALAHQDDRSREGITYAYFVVIRADVRLIGPTISESFLKALQQRSLDSVAFIPGAGDAGGDFGGIQNIFGIYSHKAIVAFMNFTEAVSSDSIAELPGLPYKWFAEGVLKLHLERQHVKIIRVDVHFCRASNLGCRYPGEVNSAMLALAASHKKKSSKKECHELCETMINHGNRKEFELNKEDAAASQGRTHPKLLERYGSGGSSEPATMKSRCCDSGLASAVAMELLVKVPSPNSSTVKRQGPVLNPAEAESYHHSSFFYKRSDPMCFVWMEKIKGFPYCIESKDPYCCKVFQNCAAALE